MIIKVQYQIAETMASDTVCDFRIIAASVAHEANEKFSSTKKKKFLKDFL